MWEDFESRYTGEEIESMLERAETKQDVITDLDVIRSNSQKGATAVQPYDLASVATSGSYDDLSDKPTIPDGTITGVSVNSEIIARQGIADIPPAATSRYGVTKLTSATDSTSEALAATAKAVKSAYDLASAKYSKPSTGIPKSDLSSAVHLEWSTLSDRISTEGVRITEVQNELKSAVKSVSAGVTLGEATAGEFFNVAKDAQGNVSIQMIQNTLASGKVAIPYTTDVKQYIDDAIANVGGGGGGATQSEIIKVAVDGGYAEIDNIADNTIYHIVGGVVNELYVYFFKDNLYRGTTIRFKSGTDTMFEIFDNVLWANGVAPTIEDNTWYELSLTTSMDVGGSASYMLAVLTPFKLV